MRASCCNFKSTLGLHLAAHLAQVLHIGHWLGGPGLHDLPALCVHIRIVWRCRRMGHELLDHIQQVLCPKDFNGRNKSGLLRAIDWQHQPHIALLTLQRQRSGQCPTHRAQCACQR